MPFFYHFTWISSLKIIELERKVNKFWLKIYFHNVTIRNQYHYKRTIGKPNCSDVCVGYVFPIQDIHLQFPADKSGDLKLQSLLEADPLEICSWSLQVPRVLFSLQCNSINSIPPALIGPLCSVCKGLGVKYNKEWASVFLLCGFSAGEGSSLPFPRRAKAISSVTGNRSAAPGCWQCLWSLTSLTSPCWVFVHLPSMRTRSPPSESPEQIGLHVSIFFQLLSIL